MIMSINYKQIKNTNNKNPHIMVKLMGILTFTLISLSLFDQAKGNNVIIVTGLFPKNITKQITLRSTYPNNLTFQLTDNLSDLHD